MKSLYFFRLISPFFDKQGLHKSKMDWWLGFEIPWNTIGGRFSLWAVPFGPWKCIYSPPYGLRPFTKSRYPSHILHPPLSSPNPEAEGAESTSRLAPPLIPKHLGLWGSSFCSSLVPSHWRWCWCHPNPLPGSTRKIHPLLSLACGVLSYLRWKIGTFEPFLSFILRFSMLLSGSSCLFPRIYRSRIVENRIFLDLLLD